MDTVHAGTTAGFRDRVPAHHQASRIESRTKSNFGIPRNPHHAPTTGDDGAILSRRPQGRLRVGSGPDRPSRMPFDNLSVVSIAIARRLSSGEFFPDSQAKPNLRVRTAPIPFNSSKERGEAAPSNMRRRGGSKESSRTARPDCGTIRRRLRHTPRRLSPPRLSRLSGTGRADACRRAADWPRA